MIAYFDCFAGISGDKTLGALLGLGVPPEWLQGELGRLPLAGFTLKPKAVSVQGISACSVKIKITATGPGRRASEIRTLIEESPFSRRVRNRSLTIFDRLAGARSRVHGGLLENLLFSETDAVDLLVDIVGTALGLEHLEVEAVSASRVPLGSGLIQSRGGWLPVPVPATLDLLKGVPVYGSGLDGELITPTGAAIVTALADHFGPPPEMILARSACGAGKNNLGGMPNVLRILLGTRAPGSPEHLLMVATGIDDMNPEIFGYLMEQLFADGALDVFWTPIYMKKNRPATMVQVLCPLSRREAVVQRLLTETTSTGVRCHTVERYTLFRETVRVETPFGRLPVKRILDRDGQERFTPEFEICREIARRQGIPLIRVYELVQRAAVSERAPDLKIDSDAESPEPDRSVKSPSSRSANLVE